MHKPFHLTLIGLVVTLVGSAGAVSAKDVVPPLEPLDIHPRTASNVVAQVRKNHFTQNLKFGDEASSEVFDQYLKTLDPRRMFLLSTDVEEFENYRYTFDDALKLGKLDSGFKMFNRVQQRQIARFDWVLERLEKGLESFDLESDDSILERDDESSWPADQEEADSLWEKVLTDNIIRFRLNDESGEEDVIEVLTKRYTRYRKYEAQTNSDDAFQTYMNAFTTWFDPHTEYLPPRDSEQFDILMSLRLQGIGAVLSTVDDHVQIQSLLPGGPADLNGGVKDGDRIVSVSQDASGPLIDVVGWRLDEVVDLIRGPKGTTVLLEIKRPGESGDTRVVAIVRDEVKLEESAASKKIVEIEDLGENRRIGVIDLPSMYADFDAKKNNDPDYRSATKDVRRLINELKAEGIDGLIIDLRGNGGGSLDEAHSLTGLFIATGPTVLVKSLHRRPYTWTDMNPELAWDGPLAVVVDHRSASASEIFAGAIQDYGRGLVVGKQTFGKGTVQQLLPLRYGKLKVTQAKYYRISGESTQHKGVTPDIEFPYAVDTSAYGESKFDSALAHDAIEGPVYKAFGDLSPYIEELRKLHKERTQDNPDFVYLRAFEQRIAEDTEKTAESLNEEVRRKERNDYDEWKLGVENARLTAKGEEPVEDLNKLRDVLDELREKQKDQPDGILVETGHILNDFINLDNPLALIE